MVGRLTKDIDLHYTKSDKAVASFTLASQRNYTNANGEYEADFIDCVIWGKPAESLERNTKKGMLIGVTGPLTHFRQKSPILYRWVMNAVRYEGYRW